MITDELLLVSRRILAGLVVNETAVQRNLENYAPFAATERVLMATARAGADRQEMHERLRRHALAAWQAVQAGEPNLLVDMLCADEALLRYASEEEIKGWMSAGDYLGAAPGRARAMAESIRVAIDLHPG